MSRSLPDWLGAYRRFTEPHEAPSWFHLHCGMVTLAAALGRRSFLDRGAYVLYPNLYTLLMATTAKCRKSSAINLARDLLIDANIEVMADKITPQAIVKQGQVATKASGLFEVVLISDELRVLLPGKSAFSEDAVVLLTKLWDCPRRFVSNTISRGQEVMENVCVNWLAGTTGAWLTESASMSAVNGGLVGRMLICESSDSSKCIPLPILNTNLRLALLSDLLHIKTLTGKFILTPNAEAAFSSWYKLMRNAECDEQLDGTIGRIHDQAFKVAMILSASEGDTLVIEDRHLKAAFDLVEDVCLQVSDGVLAAGCSQKERRIAKQIEKRGAVSHSVLLRQNSYDTDAKAMANIIASLVECDRIDVVIGKGKKIYIWKE